MISRSLASYPEAMELWASGRQSGSASLSNLFPSEHAIRRWCSEGVLHGSAVVGASLIVRRDRDFLHAYLQVSDHAAGLDLLGDVDDDEVVVADIVDRSGSHEPLVEVFERAGFAPYRRLVRVMRQPHPIEGPEPIDEVVDAVEADADVILGYLEEHFDRYSEQLPSLGEVHDEIADRRVLVVRSDGGLAGFLWHGGSGPASAVRYWFVSPRRRDGRVGARLLRTYLAARYPGSRSSLWVVDDNVDALKRYDHYGYSPDGLTDRVFMRGEPR